MKLHELQEQRASAVASMRALTDKADAEKRDLSDDEHKSFTDLKTKVAGLDRNIEVARDLAEAERAAPAILHSGRLGDGAYEQRAREFSITKAICARLGDNVDDGLEREISSEVARRSGRKFQGIAVPDEVFYAEKRTLLAGSTAADFIPNVHRADLFIDRLRASLITGRLGATILDNLVGTVDIPKQTGSSSAQWVAEDGSITETDATLTDVNLTPKTVGAMTSFSRRTLISAAPSVEQLVRNDLAAVIANAIDYQAMVGDGSSNTPTGITNAGASSATLATPSWAQVLAFISAIQASDADVGALGWAMNPYAAAKLRGTLKVSGDAGAGYLMDAPNAMAGYAAAVTSALPGNPGTSPATAGTVIFGAWSQLLIGYWSGVDILANPYETTAYAKGRVIVRAMRDCDVQVRHAAAFAYAADLTV